MQKESCYKICIFYHVPERELDSCLMIADEIRKLRPNVKISIQEFSKGIIFSLIHKPDIILTIPPRDKYASTQLTIVKRVTGCAVLSLLTEGYYQELSEEKVQINVGTQEYSPYLVDKYLFWGEKTRECFVKILKANNKISDESRSQTVGYVYYDKDNVESFFKGKKLPVGLQKWKDNYNKRILVLTGFPRAEYTHTDLISMCDYKYYGVKGKEEEYAQEVKAWDALRQKHRQYREKYLNCVIELAQCHPDIGILVKLHPVELQDFLEGKKYQCYQELEKYNNIILLRESVLLGRILPYVDTLVHYGSTSGLEAYIYNIPTVQLYDSSIPEKAYEPGFCIYDSTVKLDVNDTGVFEEVVSAKIVPRSLKSTERILEEQFNWTEDNKAAYHPTKTYAKIILDSFGKGQKIDDYGYRLALQSNEGSDVAIYFTLRAFKGMVSGKRKLAAKYWAVMKEMDISFYDWIKIVVCKLNKKLNKFLLYKKS